MKTLMNLHLCCNTRGKIGHKMLKDDMRMGQIRFIRVDKRDNNNKNLSMNNIKYHKNIRLVLMKTLESALIRHVRKY